MARPKIGVFGALFAVGSVLAWRWVQRQRAAQAPLARDLTRWEGEGGSVTEPQHAPGAEVAPAAHLRSGNGADHGASGDAWPFPRG
ncbi:hypothetical protein J8I87_18215 [Paraburkholderia sp. LEh10]|uniref:hypothetical protein n=1 Tax=Paraburkholderia sp. LEh10 TaxID=2821353 RepID=UPI001AE8D237|nr:hypothetical protein [Paraburkholderia sp. LEh10]MBP0591628.1 hypothetical protein [Paraburkholderia sp. LEh10]